MILRIFVLSNVCSIFILLSQESEGGAIFWMNPHLLRSCPFPSFLVVSLTSYHLICCLFTVQCSKSRNRDNHHKVPYPRMQQRVRSLMRVGVEPTSDHAIVITRSPQKQRFNPLSHTSDNETYTLYWLNQ